MGNLLGVCTNKQIRLLQDKLDERFPNERIDFSRQLPRKLSLHILKFLDPRSLSRCAQVSWYWKFLSESDELWRPKCLRFGWYPPYKPRYWCSRAGVGTDKLKKRHFIAFVAFLSLFWVAIKTTKIILKSDSLSLFCRFFCRFFAFC